MDEKTLVTIEVAVRILSVLAGAVAGAIARKDEMVPLPEELFITRTAEDALREAEKKD